MCFRSDRPIALPHRCLGLKVGWRSTWPSEPQNLSKDCEPTVRVPHSGLASIACPFDLHFQVSTSCPELPKTCGMSHFQDHLGPSPSQGRGPAAPVPQGSWYRSTLSPCKPIRECLGTVPNPSETRVERGFLEQTDKVPTA